MLKFGDVFSNILTLAIIFGLGYIIYMKMKEKDGYSPFKNLFNKAGDVMKKVNVKK